MYRHIASTIISIVVSLGVSCAQASVIQLDIPSASTGCTVRNAIKTANTNVNVSTCMRTGPATEPDTLLVRAGNYEENAQAPYDNEDGNLSGDYDITSAIIIQGDSTATSNISASPLDRLFDVQNGGSLTLRDLSITGGSVLTTIEPFGGTIRKRSGGTLVLERVHVRDGSAELGGSIYAQLNSGPLTINSSTLRDGYASSLGGAIAIEGNGPGSAQTTLINTTLSRNTASAASAIHVSFSPLRMRSSTITGNRASANNAAFVYHGSAPAELVEIGNSLLIGNVNDVSTSADMQCDPGIQLAKKYYSIIGGFGQCTFGTSGGTPGSSDVRLLPLFDYGAAIWTHALDNGSAAINAGNATGVVGCPSLDARGVARNGTCDIGAFELRFDATVNSIADLPDATPGDGQCRTNGNVCTLRAATMEANATGGRWLVAVPAGIYNLNPMSGGNDDRSGDLDIKPSDIDLPATSFILYGLGNPATTQIVGGGNDRVLEARSRFYINNEREDRLLSFAMTNLTLRDGNLTQDPFAPDNESLSGGGVNIVGTHSMIYNTVIRDNDLRPLLGNGSGAGLSMRVDRYQGNFTLPYPNDAWVERFAVIDNVGEGDVALSKIVSSGGIAAYGPDLSLNDGITLINGTIAGNRADTASALRLSNQSYGSFLTITGNQVPAGTAPSATSHSAVVPSSSAHSLQNSIIAGNFDGATPADCATPLGSLISGGYLLIGNTANCIVSGDTSNNLLGVDPLLGPRQTAANGMSFYRVTANSPAANEIPRALCNDHRGRGVTSDAVGNDRPGTNAAPIACELGATEGLGAADSVFANGFE